MNEATIQYLKNDNDRMSAEIQRLYAEKRALAEYIAKLEGDKEPACVTCADFKAQGITFFPAHRASGGCQSGGRAHCTCDTCF